MGEFGLINVTKCQTLTTSSVLQVSDVRQQRRPRHLPPMQPSGRKIPQIRPRSLAQVQGLPGQRLVFNRLISCRDDRCLSNNNEHK